MELYYGTVINSSLIKLGVFPNSRYFLLKCRLANIGIVLGYTRCQYKRSANPYNNPAIPYNNSLKYQINLN